VEVMEIQKDKNRIILQTRCRNQQDQLVIDGKAIVSPPKKG